MSICGTNTNVATTIATNIINKNVIKNISIFIIANRILTEGEKAVEDYFKFLCGGSSTDPVSLLKLAGVDLTTSKPFEFAMGEFDKTLTEFEKLMKI